TTPPIIKNVIANPNSLWPPNHKLRNIAINYNVKDNCDALQLITCDLSVSSDEPVDGGGDGNPAPDWNILGTHEVLLRSERAGNGDGRIYTNTITCTDTN